MYPVIFVGYDLNKVLDGLSLLNTDHIIDGIFLIRDNKKDGFGDISRNNCRDIKDNLLKYAFRGKNKSKVQVIDCNPQEFTDVIRVLTYVKEKNSEENTEKIYVDLTSAARPAFVAASQYACFFGMKTYIVKPEKYRPITKQPERIFNKMFEDNNIKNLLVQEFSKLISTSSKLIDEHELKNIFEKTISKHYADVTIQEIREIGGEKIETLSYSTKLIDLTELDKLIFINLSEVNKAITIKQITENINKREYSEQKVAYRVRRLSDWGFLTKIGQRNASIRLSDLGSGYAKGLKMLYDEKNENGCVLENLNIRF